MRKEDRRKCPTRRMLQCPRVEFEVQVQVEMDMDVEQAAVSA